MTYFKYLHVALARLPLTFWMALLAASSVSKCTKPYPLESLLDESWKMTSKKIEKPIKKKRQRKKLNFKFPKFLSEIKTNLELVSQL
jgi:hypothetical protein